MVYNGYYKVMSNIPKMGQLPTPEIWLKNTESLQTQSTNQYSLNQSSDCLPVWSRPKNCPTSARIGKFHGFDHNPRQ
jgi:hypothetical protein